jgi:hypothetical protein
MRLLYLSIVVLSFSLAGIVQAQPASLLAAEQARFRAQVEEDTAALQELLHEELYYLHSNGLAESKTDFIASVRSGKIDYQRMVPRDRHFRRYGKTALLTGLVEVEGLYQGKTFALELYYTSVYLRKRGRWQLVSWQSTAKTD